jgi:hypothetical protein
MNSLFKQHNGTSGGLGSVRAIEDRKLNCGLSVRPRPISHADMPTDLTTRSARTAAPRGATPPTAASGRLGGRVAWC